MAKKPPLLPTETLTRVINLATMDGRILLVLAGTFAVLAALVKDLPGSLIGCLAAGAGALELHGTSLLNHRDIRGLDWIIRSQLVLLATILIYAAARLTQTPEEIIQLFMTPERTKLLEQIHVSKADVSQLAAQLYTVLYVAVGIVSIFYQGGMAYYYQRRRAAIASALDDDAPDQDRD